MDITVGKIRIQ